MFCSLGDIRKSLVTFKHLAKPVCLSFIFFSLFFFCQNVSTANDGLMLIQAWRAGGKDYKFSSILFKNMEYLFRYFCHIIMKGKKTGIWEAQLHGKRSYAQSLLAVCNK